MLTNLCSEKNYSVYDIRDALERSGPDRLSVTAIQEVLREEGFSRLPRRADEDRPNRARPMPDQVADVRTFRLTEGEFSTHAGGLFLLLPLLVRLDLDRLVTHCGLPGTTMIPAPHAIRAALLLKLLGKSPRRHVMDLVFDPGVALAVGLNAIPMGAWIEGLRSEKLFEGKSFNLDFHSIAYFGEDPLVEKHYVPRRSQRRKAVLAFLAQDADAQLFCYSNADIRKGEERDEVLRFVRFWEQRYGERPRHLVFDSKLTTHGNLSKLNALGITFITLRARSPKLIAAFHSQPRSAWKVVPLEVPHRKYKTPRVIDQRVTLSDYSDSSSSEIWAMRSPLSS